MSKNNNQLDKIKKVILDSGVLDEHDKNVGGDLYSPEGNQELTADALAQYLLPMFSEAEIRIDEHKQALADFEPEYLILSNPRKVPHLTDLGKLHLQLLSDRYTYHKKRIKELESGTADTTGLASARLDVRTPASEQSEPSA